MLIGFLGFFIEVHASDNIYTSLSQAVCHSAASTEEVYCSNHVCSFICIILNFPQSYK